jgi:hypothetical protein
LSEYRQLAADVGLGCRARPAATGDDPYDAAMPIDWLPQGMLLALVGLGVGLWLLARGLADYRLATQIGDTSTSRVGTLAAGEVQVSGVIEPAELTLVSPLQSTACVYYRSTIDGADEGINVGGGLAEIGADFFEERAVGFRVRDESGDIRVFPRGARWDAPTTLDDSTGLMGDEPPGLRIRTGSALAPTGLGRDAAIAALLAVPDAMPDFRPLAILGGSARDGLTGGDRRRHYREAILAPGDAVTILGKAIPFGDLADPAEADVAVGSELAADDTEVLGDISEARQAGLLEASPEAAWGNAAIPGFGIGQPARTPVLDPRATALPLAEPEHVAEAERRFSITPDTLVLASGPGEPLLIAHGLPSAAVERRQGRFLLGLLGAVLAIASAMALALIVPGALGS